MKHFFHLLFIGTVLIPALRANDGGLSIAGQAGASLRMGFGARGMGMANVLSSEISNEMTPYYNPALLPFQSSWYGSAGVGFLSLDRKLNFLSIVRPMEPTAGFALSVINSGVSNIEGRSRSGLLDETYSTSENAFLFSFGNRFSSKLAVGISMKIFYYSLFEKVSSTTVGVDAGVFYKISDMFSAAVVVQDIGSKYVWNSSKAYNTQSEDVKEKFPLRVKFCFSAKPIGTTSLIGIEGERIGDEFLARIGAEYQIVDEMRVRAGIDQISLNGAIDCKPSFGLSFSKELAGVFSTLHYAYVIEPYGPSNTHFLTLSVCTQ
jgi:hypothetical protein